MTEFGAWLRQKMEDVGTNQRQLAIAMDISAASVSNWIRGEREPSMESCYAIADALALDPEEVMERAGILKPNADRPHLRELHRLVDELEPGDVPYITRMLRFFLSDQRRIKAERAKRVPESRANFGLATTRRTIDDDDSNG